MNKTNDIKENFAALLRDSLRSRFGRIPSAAIVAREFNLRAYDTPPISQESARRWIRGVSLPEEQRLRVLVNWLNLDFNAALRPGRNLNGHGLPSHQLNGSLNGHKHPQQLNVVEIPNRLENGTGLSELIGQLNADQKQMLESFMKAAFTNSPPTP
jgi:hypothetical protein